MSKSIVPGNINNMCHYCGRYVEVPHKHHIFGAYNRKFSEKYGLWVYLCPYHHNMSKYSVHQDAKLMDNYHKLGQKVFQDWYMDENGADQETAKQKFMEIFGRNYL